MPSPTPVLSSKQSIRNYPETDGFHNYPCRLGNVGPARAGSRAASMRAQAKGCAPGGTSGLNALSRLTRRKPC